MSQKRRKTVARRRGKKSKNGDGRQKSEFRIKGKIKDRSFFVIAKERIDLSGACATEAISRTNCLLDCFSRPVGIAMTSSCFCHFRMIVSGIQEFS